MKLIITIIFLLLFGSLISIEAQKKKTSPVTKAATTEAAKTQPCSVSLKNSPTARGLRLEMTKAEVKKEYPSMVFTDDFPKDDFKEKDNAGLAKKAQLANSAHRENLEEVGIIFGKDNRILLMTFTFGVSTYSSSLAEFADKISESLKLPKNRWQPSRGGGNSLSLYCDGFGVTVEYTEEKKPLLFLSKAPETLTDADRDNLKP